MMRATEARIARLEAADPTQSKIRLVVRVIVEPGEDADRLIAAEIARKEAELGQKFAREEVSAMVCQIVDSMPAPRAPRSESQAVADALRMITAVCRLASK